MLVLTAPSQARLTSREYIFEEQKLNLLWSPHVVHFFLVLCTPKEHQNPPIYTRSMKVSMIYIFLLIINFILLLLKTPQTITPF